MQEIKGEKINWRELMVPISVAGLMLLLSIVASYAAGVYAIDHASHSVKDILLDNLPFVNTGHVFIYGSLIAIVALLVVLSRKPYWVPFVFKSLALFILIRSGFVLLTHIGPAPQQATFDDGTILARFFLGDDFFFSGHTGLPFLIALILWDYRGLRNIAIMASIFFASCALLGHLHYSIDVFAAYFITYTIFEISKKAFPRDYSLFLRGK